MDAVISPTISGAEEACQPLPRREKRIEDLIPLRNPLVLGSGPLGTTADLLTKYSEFAGGVVTKTITWDPCHGNPRPRVKRLSEDSMLNWEGVPNLGYHRTVEEIRIAARKCSCPVIASIWPGERIEAIQEMAAGFEAAGAQGIEVDFKWGMLDDDRIARICRALKETISVPLIAKLSIFAGDICQHGRLVEEAGCDAITAINSVAPAMKIDVERQRPVLATGWGGLSGKPILPFAVAAVYELYRTVAIPIIGSGGVIDGEAALELIMAGADVVQMFTIGMLEGPAAFRRVLDEFETLVEALGFESYRECRGIAHQRGSSRLACVDV